MVAMVQNIMPNPTPTIYPYALTTLEHIKTRLNITVTTWDNILIRMINSVTDHIEGQCGLSRGKHFVQTTYTNDVYSVVNGRQEYLVLRAGNVTAIANFQYRAGTVSTPSWTNFITDQWEYKNPQPRPDDTDGTKLWGPSGIIRVYGVLPRLMDNMLRVTYTAGYAVDWENEGTSSHWLPEDLTQLADDLVTRWWKRRELAGQSGQTLEGQTVTGWRNEIDADDIAIINRHKRLQFYG